MTNRLTGALLGASFLLACSQSDRVPPGGEIVDVTVAALTAPSDGQCTHVTATNVSDFSVAEYKGPTSAASLKAKNGETIIRATAYPSPCTSEPVDAPWVADEMLVTLVSGRNTVALAFKPNVKVDLNPSFQGDRGDLTLVAGSTVKTGRNNEDAAAGGFSLDGWDVTALTYPPSPATETFVFTTKGKGLPYTPRGMARTPDGRFVFQVAEVFEPVRVLDAAGNPIASWSVSYPAGAVIWEFTEGIEAIDNTHFVRTGYTSQPVNCSPDGTTGCVGAGLDLLEVATAGGIPFLQVTSQIYLPESIGMNLEYPVGVAPLAGGNFAVSTLPDTNSKLAIISPSGAVVAGPVSITGDAEGLFDTGDGRIAAVTYLGGLTTYDAVTLAPGGSAAYSSGLGVQQPFGVAWDSLRNQHMVITSETPQRLWCANAGFSSIADCGIPLAGYSLVNTLDYRADLDQVLIGNRVPASVDGGRPRIDFWSASTRTKVGSAILNGLTLPIRLRTGAFIPSTGQMVTHYRRPGVPSDSTLDAVAFVHNMDGSLAYSFDLAPTVRAVRIVAVNALPATNELLFQIVDAWNISRLLVTDTHGAPHRSYRVDSMPTLIDAAAITSGPNAGTLAIVSGQPSQYARGVLP